jgi:hypothetical protein
MWYCVLYVPVSFQPDLDQLWRKNNLNKQLLPSHTINSSFYLLHSIIQHSVMSFWTLNYNYKLYYNLIHLCTFCCAISLYLRIQNFTYLQTFKEKYLLLFYNFYNFSFSVSANVEPSMFLHSAQCICTHYL